MSKANSPIKVLRAALNRIQKAWVKSVWKTKLDDGNYGVCLEGAIFGYCNRPQTQAQKDALKVVQDIVKERGFHSVPNFNDSVVTTKDDVIEVIKLAIIRIETGYLDEQEIQEVLDNFPKGE